MKLLISLAFGCLFILGELNGNEIQTHFSITDPVQSPIVLPSQLSLEISLEYTSSLRKFFDIAKSFWKKHVIMEQQIDTNIDLLKQKIVGLLKNRKDNFIDFQSNYENDVNEIIIILLETSILVEKVEKEHGTSLSFEKYYIQSMIEELTNPVCIESVELHDLPGIPALRNAKGSLERARFLNNVRTLHPKPDVYFATVLTILDKAIKQIEIFPELYATYYREAMQYAVETLEILKYQLKRAPWTIENHKIYTDVCNALAQLKSSASDECIVIFHTIEEYSVVKIENHLVQIRITLDDGSLWLIGYLNSRKNYT